MAKKFLPFKISLNEDSVGRVNQGKQSRTRIPFPRAVAGICRIAQVQKGGQKERNMESTSQAETTSNWPRIRKGGGVDQIERLTRLSGICPHSPSNRIASESQALPESIRRQGKRFQRISSAREAHRNWVAPNLHLIFDLHACRQTSSLPRPKGLQIECRCSEYGNSITDCSQIS